MHNNTEGVLPATDWDSVQKWVWNLIRSRLISSKFFVRKQRQRRVPRPVLLPHLEFTAHTVSAQTCRAELTHHSSHSSVLCSLLSIPPFSFPWSRRATLSADCGTSWADNPQTGWSPSLVWLAMALLYIHCSHRVIHCTYTTWNVMRILYSTLSLIPHWNWNWKMVSHWSPDVNALTIFFLNCCVQTYSVIRSRDHVCFHVQTYNCDLLNTCMWFLTVLLRTYSIQCIPCV